MSIVVIGGTNMGTPSVSGAGGGGGATVLATLDGVSQFVALSNGNLTATRNAGTPSGARSSITHTSGKFYFEVTIGATHGIGDCAGVAQVNAIYNDLVSAGINCTVAYCSNGEIFSNNADSTKSIGAIVVGNVIGVAVDLTARKGWLRKNAGNWDGDATHDPATGAGGVTITAAVAFGPTLAMGGTSGQLGDAMTANFGQSAYANAAPAGFGNWI